MNTLNKAEVYAITKLVAEFKATGGMQQWLNAEYPANIAAHERLADFVECSANHSETLALVNELLGETFNY